MTVEAASYISELNPSYPADADNIKEGGGPTNAPGSAPGHINMMKTVLQTQFSGLSGTTAVTSSETELNLLDGITALVSLATAQEWTKTQNFNESSLTLSGTPATIAWDLASNQVSKFTLDEAATLSNPTNQVAGAFYSVKVLQDGTGGYSLSWGTSYYFPGGTAPTNTTTADATDVWVFRSDGTYMYMVGQQLDVKAV